MNEPVSDPHAELGVSRHASHAEIRRAYRALARRFHPDSGGSRADAERLARVNEAWRLLSDPQRPRVHREAPATPPRPVAHPPARFPWRAMLWLGGVGIVVVVVASVLSGPADAPAPDQILGPGSCVVIDGAGLAAEVSCDGPHDAVVTALVPFDGSCPPDSRAHRDRQGLGVACVVAPEVPGAEPRG